MVERIAELDDELTVKYLEGKEISIDELKTALRKAVLDKQSCSGLLWKFPEKQRRSAGVGCSDRLSSFSIGCPCRYMGRIPGTDEHNRITRPRMMQSLSALVFKIVTDPYVGRLAYFRVYSGTLSQGQMVTNSTKGKRERIGRLLRMYADHREDVTEVRAGDIAAVLGFKDTFTGDTLVRQQAGCA